MSEERQAAERAVNVLRECNPLMHPNWTEDAISAILAEFAPLLAANDPERDRLAKQVERLRELLREGVVLTLQITSDADGYARREEWRQKIGRATD